MMTLPGLHARPYTGEADLQPLVDLFAACEAADHLDDYADVEGLRGWFESPGVDPARDLRLWIDTQSRVMGFGWVGVPEPSTAATVEARAFFRVHPTARAGDLGGAILTWAGERGQEAGCDQGKPAQIYIRVPEHDTYHRAALEQHGFAIVRYYLRLARALDEPIPEPQLPPGFTLRYVQTEAEVEQWVETFNLSFIDHWNFQPMPVERRKHWISGPDYRPEQDLVIVAPDGTFAAFCHCGIHPQENAQTGRNEGWIHVLGTRRGYRQQGLGRAILLAGLQRLKADGAATALLLVDATNPTGALGLYESAGFHKVSTLVYYCQDLGE